MTATALNGAYVCVQCGKAFRPKRADRITCCSRECGFELRRTKGRLAKLLSAEREIYRRWANRKRSGYAERINYLRAKLSRRSAYANSACASCGGRVGYSGAGRPRVYCSEACKEVGYPARRQLRVERALRRPKLYSVTADRIDPLEVMERDNWRCHICGGHAPPELRGTMRWNAPEVDHIIPLARGGPHTMANVACAHRSCNIEKGDSAINGEAGAPPERRWVHAD